MTRRKRHYHAKPAERPERVSKVGVMIEAASPGSRFLAGMLDFVVLLCCSTIVTVAIGGDPLFFHIAVCYFLDLASLYAILTGYSALLGFTILLLLSLPYFALEGMIGLSLGKYLFGLRIAGKRTLRKAFARSLVKSIPPLSFIDFLFVYKNLKHTQRFSDHMLDLGVAKLKSQIKKNAVLLDERNRAYLISGFIMFFLPLVTFVMYSVVFSSTSGFVSAPAPDFNFDYKPNLDFWLTILVTNFYIAYTYYLFGGLLLCLPMILQLFFQGLVAGTLVSGVILSHPQFLLFGILPHLLLESIGFAHLMASGLIVSETLLDLVMRYRRGESIASNRSFLGSQLIRVLKLSLLGVLTLLAGSFIEVYVTPLILLAFYFH